MPKSLIIDAVADAAVELTEDYKALVRDRRYDEAHQVLRAIENLTGTTFYIEERFDVETVDSRTSVNVAAKSPGEDYPH